MRKQKQLTLLTPQNTQKLDEDESFCKIKNNKKINNGTAKTLEMIYDEKSKDVGKNNKIE